MVLRLTPKPEFFNSPSQVAAFVADARIIGVDTETVGADGTPEGALDVHSNRITVWSIATADRRAACSRYALEGLKEGLRINKRVKVVIHNFSFDGPVLRRSGVNLPDLVSPDRLVDTLILDNLLNPDGAHDLKFLSKTRLKISYRKYKSYGFNDDDYGCPEQGIPPSERFSDYASLDAWCTVKLYHHLISQLSNRQIYDGAPLVFGNRLESLRDYYEVIEQPLMAILHQMSTTGVRIDVQYLKGIEPILDEQLARTHADLCKTAWILFNPSSPDQVRMLLYDDLGYPVQNVKSRKTGDLSVSEKVLKALMALPPPEPKYAELPMGIALYRQRRLLKTTFVTGLINKLVRDRLHSVFNQHRTATGRLSSSAPNLQNIPKSSDPSIRRAFIPSEGYRFIDADYAQIELRVLAHLSQATTMLDPILAGIDLHSLTAASLANTTYDELLEAVAASKLHGVEMSERHQYLIRMRAIAKVVNFGIPYGISAQGILVNLQTQAGIRITLQECQLYLDKYWEDHPDVWEYNLGLIGSVRESGIVHTYLGRQRPISGLRGKRANSHSINQTYNTPIQGSAGDLLKIAMLNMYRDQRFQDLGLRMVLQVHDELVIETPEENDAEGLELVQELMPQHLVPFSVPLDIDAQLGDNWGDLH